MKVLVIAPHPDDETLGCGGTLLRHKKSGDELFWLIVTEISKDMGYSKEVIKKRDKEISAVTRKYSFDKIYNLKLPTTLLDTIPISKLVKKISRVFGEIKPECIYMPYMYDIHTDHQLISKAIQSSIKWFRHDYIRRVLMYETISETDFNFIGNNVFRPNVFVDIASFIDKKVDIMNIYESETGEKPFPRSEENIRSLSILRGSQSGFNAAEAFELVFERK